MGLNKMIANTHSDSEIFSLATQFYVRLRRVTGRVVDVLYMVENTEYAKHLLHLAESIEDNELQRYVSSLNALILPNTSQVTINQREEPLSNEQKAVQKLAVLKQQANWSL